MTPTLKRDEIASEIIAAHPDRREAFTANGKYLEIDPPRVLACRSPTAMRGGSISSRISRSASGLGLGGEIKTGIKPAIPLERSMLWQH
jgi:hypothetical protein